MARFGRAFPQTRVVLPKRAQHIPEPAQEAHAATMTATGTVSLSLQVNKAFSYSATGTVTLEKQVQKAFSHSATGTPEALKSVSKSFDYSGVGSSVLSTVRVRLVSLSFTATGTPSPPVKQISKLFNHSATGTPTLSRQISKAFSIAATGGAALLRQIAKAFSFSATGTATAVASTSEQVTASMTATGTVTLATLKIDAPSVNPPVFATFETPYDPRNHIPAGRILDRATMDSLMTFWADSGYRELSSEEIELIVGLPRPVVVLRSEFGTGDYPPPEKIH